MYNFFQGIFVFKFLKVFWVCTLWPWLVRIRYRKKRSSKLPPKHCEGSLFLIEVKSKEIQVTRIIYFHMFVVVVRRGFHLGIESNTRTKEISKKMLYLRCTYTCTYLFRFGFKVEAVFTFGKYMGLHLNAPSAVRSLSMPKIWVNIVLYFITLLCFRF